MKPINIYILTRVNTPYRLQRLERQMSGRHQFLSIKEWEIDGLRKLADLLKNHLLDTTCYEFYYSFQLPKLGKEFDLLRISEHHVVNIELKSGNVSDEAVRKQLLQNRYYLAMLGKVTYSYTYISSQNRLVRLSNSGKLVETDGNKLCEDLLKQKNCYEENIEELFKEDKFLLSPLADPDKFLRLEYILTYQQRDIKKKILSKAGQKGCSYQGFTGLPGTGKTLLLYDIAMQLSWKEKVCILHFGQWSKEMEQLDRRLKRIDFINCMEGEDIKFRGEYAALCVDEGHRMSLNAMQMIKSYVQGHKIPVIISYDSEEIIAPQERQLSGSDVIESLANYTKYRLTNRIRLNREISFFIHKLMCLKKTNDREYFPSVKLYYANDQTEADLFLVNCKKDGYTYIRDRRIDSFHVNESCFHAYSDIEIENAACREFDKVVMLVDGSFYYGTEGYLRAEDNKKEKERIEMNVSTEDNVSKVRCLFHGLNRAKKQIALIVLDNKDVFDRILYILQK